MTELRLGKTFTSDKGLEYRVKGLIEKGGESRVLLVKGEDDHFYAAKQFIATREFRGISPEERFEVERRILAELSRAKIDGIAAVCDSSDERLTLIMEYVEGRTLSHALDRRDSVLDPIDVAIIVGYVASTLDDIAALGITHNDTKPENILLSPVANLYFGSSNCSRPKLERVIKPSFIRVVDFSFARINGWHPSDSHREMVLGTPPYIAPENLLRRPSKRSDIFALGILAYEMLQGMNYFEDITSEEMLLIVGNGGLPSLLGATRRELGGFERVIYAMVHYDPAKRPTAKQVYEAAKDYLARRGIDLNAAMPKRANLANQSSLNPN